MVINLLKYKALNVGGIIVKISPATENIPVIYKLDKKSYLEYTDSNGKAVALNIRTQAAPIEDQIVAYPAGHKDHRQWQEDALFL